MLPVGAGDFLPMDAGTMLPVAMLCSPGALTVTCGRHWERRWRNRLGRLAGRNRSHVVTCALGRENQSLTPLGLEQKVDGFEHQGNLYGVEETRGETEQWYLGSII